MDTQHKEKLDQLVSSYLQRPLRSYEEVLRASEASRSTASDHVVSAMRQIEGI